MNQTESSFLQNVVLAAQQSMREFGVPASITIAQAILESGWGQSGLAKQANNFFGIKATAMADASQYIEMSTDEFVDGRQVKEMAKFARYASPIDSFKAHGYLLSMELRYRPAMEAKGDASKFAQALQDCGYSTSPDYAASLMKLVTDYDLAQYDVPESGSPAAAGNSSGTTVSAAIGTVQTASTATVMATEPVVVTLHAPAGVAATGAVAAAIAAAAVKARPKVVSAAGPSRAQVLAEAEKLLAARAAAKAAAKTTPAAPAKGK